ncbi:MAG: AraC family transcriptional regulator [Candidatus Aminicenantes bacterium]|nr:AraC family transcriptional regulator [Candidatus Aminicenantes bacterium]
MKLQEIIEKMNLKPLTDVEEREVEGVFISDMLSDTMTGARAGDLWVTVQTHTNIVSAANLVDAAAVLVPQEKPVPQKTIDLANRYHVIILSSGDSTFQLAGKLAALGLSPQQG